jgi:hypothetical protein
MKQFRSAIAYAVFCVIAIAPRAAEKQPVIAVRGPTVVAFFEPVPPGKVDKDTDTNEALADFQLYARSVRTPLRKAGIEFHELYAHSFRLRIGTQSITFRPVKEDVGYYLVAPGKKPRIEYGVMTDSDLLQVANAYFGIQGSEKGKIASTAQWFHPALHSCDGHFKNVLNCRPERSAANSLRTLPLIGAESKDPENISL